MQALITKTFQKQYQHKDTNYSESLIILCSTWLGGVVGTSGVLESGPS